MAPTDRTLPAEALVDHKDAWDLAHFKREHSNLARCYIEAHQLLREMVAHGERCSWFADRGDYELVGRVKAVLDPVEKAP